VPRFAWEQKVTGKHRKLQHTIKRRVLAILRLKSSRCSTSSTSSSAIKDSSGHSSFLVAYFILFGVAVRRTGSVGGCIMVEVEKLRGLSWAAL
jgi:hypothetical protein